MKKIFVTIWLALLLQLCLSAEESLAQDNPPDEPRSSMPAPGSSDVSGAGTFEHSIPLPIPISGREEGQPANTVLELQLQRQ